MVSLGASWKSKMWRVLRAAGTVALALSCAPGLQAKKFKVQAQYSKETDFTQFKTYAWMKHDAVARPELGLEIVGAVDEELRTRGLTQVEANPDLLVTYYGGLDTDTSIAGNDPSYSRSGGVPAAGTSVWTPSSIGGGPSSSVYVQKGTLMVDLVDSKAKKLVWRGIATGTLDTNSGKALQEVDKSVEKMFAEYPAKKR
jgi:Domain of unknown function (DUF4136)